LTAVPDVATLDPGAMAGIGTHAALAALLAAPAGGIVLDAGAGQGAFTAWLADHGYRVIALGIEPSQFGFGGARFVQTNLDQGLPFRDQSVEGIAAIEVLEHLENPIGFVREASRCLQRGGWLALTTPNVKSISSRLSFLVRGHHLYFGPKDYEANGHINPVSIEQIRSVAERTGMTIEIVTYNLGKLPVPRLRHRLLLTHPRFRTALWGDALIVLLRKVRPPQLKINRG
jgi:SAM-dependent methyltransferase